MTSNDTYFALLTERGTSPGFSFGKSSEAFAFDSSIESLSSLGLFKRNT